MIGILRVSLIFKGDISFLVPVSMDFDLYLVLEAKGVVIHSLVLFRILADLKIKSMYMVLNEPAHVMLFLYVTRVHTGKVV